MVGFPSLPDQTNFHPKKHVWQSWDNSKMQRFVNIAWLFSPFWYTPFLDTATMESQQQTSFFCAATHIDDHPLWDDQRMTGQTTTYPLSFTASELAAAVDLEKLRLQLCCWLASMGMIKICGKSLADQLDLNIATCRHELRWRRHCLPSDWVLQAPWQSEGFEGFVSLTNTSLTLMSTMGS